MTRYPGDISKGNRTLIAGARPPGDDGTSAHLLSKHPTEFRDDIASAVATAPATTFHFPLPTYCRYPKAVAPQIPSSHPYKENPPYPPLMSMTIIPATFDPILRSLLSPTASLISWRAFGVRYIAFSPYCPLNGGLSFQCPGSVL